MRTAPCWSSARIGLPCATEGELVRHLNWEHGDVSKALWNASRCGFVRKSRAGEVVLTDKGQDTPYRVA